ncbi:hypothetical protein ACSV5T_10185, partial [Veillonella sp. ZSJB6]|uniref:hypothetical protein n=1 Tax=Veillonella sp. ZSJB6 TaxID=3451359 RepID=UPI003EE66269
MSIKLSEILPPADKLFDRKELEQIFLEAVRLTKEVEEETSLGFTSVKVNNYFFQAYQDENEYLLSLGSQKKETDMVKN